MRTTYMIYYNDTANHHGLGQNSAFIQNINGVIQSPLGVCLLGAFTLIAFIFSLELVFYTFVVLYAIYVALFADDFKPLMPLFILCYIAPSRINNPGENLNSIFFGETGLYIIVIVSIGVLFLLGRILFDPNMGFRRLFGTKRTLLLGMLALGASYFLSGILHPQHAEYAKGNLLFASIQFASLFLLYFIFSATIDWTKFNFDYFASIGLVVGIVVAAEVGHVYFVENIIQNGTIARENIQTGWGCYNNIGAIISLSIPFAFYFACRKKRSSVFLLLACLLLISAILSCSRSSIVGAVFAFTVSFIYTFIKCNNKVEFRVASFLFLAALIVGVWIFRERLGLIFRDLPSIFVFGEESIIINDSDRLSIYKEGIKRFLENPIFGEGFFPIGYDVIMTHIQTEQFSSFFPPRWHNTIIQMMASCGSVGVLAYLYHRISTLKLYVDKPTRANTYLLFYVGTLLGMSLLDCHFFNVGPVLFYSMAGAVAEFAPNPFE